MDFDLSDLQRLLLDSAERFTANHYSLEGARLLRESQDGLDTVAWAQFAELGWLALAIPEVDGGLGGSLEDVAVLMSALGAKCAIEPFVSSAVLAAYLIGSSDLPTRHERLSAIAGGASRVALAHDEPGERYPVIAPRRTTLRAEGDGYRLSGQKMMVLDAPSAGSLIVTASLADDGLALVLIDKNSAGVSLESYALVDGSRAADVRFDAAFVPADALVSSPLRGPALLAEAVDRASIAVMAQAVGSMEKCLTLCVAYVKERNQFGQPIGKFQALQHIIADMFVAAHQARSALYQAIARSNDDETERTRAVSLAKLVVGAASQLVSRQAIQLHGGYGMTDEYEVSHHYRRLLVLEKLYGDLDFHVLRLTRP